MLASKGQGVPSPGAQPQGGPAGSPMTNPAVPEGQKQAAIVSAEGQKESAVLAAEGQAQARLRVAEAEARAIQVVADSLKGSVSNPAQYLIAQKYLESLGTIATGADKVVFLPYEAAGTMGSLGAMKEMLTAQGK